VGICITHSAKRGESAVFAEFYDFLSSPFSEIKNSYAEKSAVFAEFHELLTCSFRICPLKTAFFVAKTNFHFIFSGMKNSYAEKSAVFANFMSFLSSLQTFFR
jgi:hypothetical protein